MFRRNQPRWRLAPKAVDPEGKEDFGPRIRRAAASKRNQECLPVPAWEVDQSDDAETIIHIAAQLGAVADHSTSVPDVVVAIHGPGAHAIAVPHALCFLGGVLSQEPEAVL